MIELTDVTRRYGSTVAVGHLSFEVRPGEVTGVLDPNGQIRATFGATPQRLTVLAAKPLAFTAVVLSTGSVASFSAFWIGQRNFASKDLDLSTADPGVLPAMAGGALYLAAGGLLGIALGAILRRTAGAVGGLFGILVLTPILGGILPASFQEPIVQFFPAQAGMALFRVASDPRALSPWTGLGVFLACVAAVLALGGLLLVRRDA